MKEIAFNKSDISLLSQHTSLQTDQLQFKDELV